ncbi:unnamed protein product [Coffea canephora]|uniref:Uncharacterized protein n=1 Tax=Coffea canephora TaxID=49390 RepID=A0A068VCA4_COFCA|nr:unnamed protein product [Coffea canephora]
MMIRPISLIRLRTTTFLTVPLSSALFAVDRSHCYFSIFAAATLHHSQNLSQTMSRKPNQPSKNLLKARETIKQLSSLAPALTQDNKPRLSKSQAVGLVAASQANFMRVIVQQLHEEENENELEDFGGGGGKGAAGEGAIGMELLCVVKVVLKKIKRRVLGRGGKGDRGEEKKSKKKKKTLL